MIEEGIPKAKVGRPKIHADKRTAQAEASKAYRTRRRVEKLKAQQEEAERLAALPQSAVIDLSALSPWLRC